MVLVKYQEFDRKAFLCHWLPFPVELNGKSKKRTKKVPLSLHMDKVAENCYDTLSVELTAKLKFIK